MPDARIGAGGTVSAAPWGSAGVLAISYAYIAMMGPDGLTKATQMALLNANYIADRLPDYYPVLYTGANDLVAHECILDLRELSASTGVSVDDVAKRLIDYGFHAPTMSFPVPGTLMVEPTESEDLGELDRFCDAMIAIRAEMDKVASGAWPVDDNPLVNAPHPVSRIGADEWSHPYPRSVAAFPAGHHTGPIEGEGSDKYWPAVARIDNAFGDRHLLCVAPPTSCWPSNSRRDVGYRGQGAHSDHGGRRWAQTRDRGGNLATAVSRRVTKVLQWAAHTPWAAHLWRANDRYNNRLGNQFAGGITYFSVLASVPVLMFAFSGLGLTLTVIRPALLDDVKGIVVANLYPGPMRDTVLQYLEQYLYHWQTVGLIAIVVALWAGAGWMGNVKSAIRAMWRPEFDMTEDKHFFFVEVAVNAAAAGASSCWWVLLAANVFPDGAASCWAWPTSAIEDLGRTVAAHLVVGVPAGWLGAICHVPGAADPFVVAVVLRSSAWLPPCCSG